MIQPLRNPSDAIASITEDGDDRSGIFPHNYDYDRFSTRDQLLAYLDPSNPHATLHPDDVEDFEGDDDKTRAYNMLNALQDAAKKGYDYAPQVDHESGKGEEIKKLNADWNSKWEKFLADFELPIEKGAAALGYRVAKRNALNGEGRLGEFFVCQHDNGTVTGCTSNQYRSDASRSAISNFFGRNKNATKFMASMPTWCRKHYQKEAYSDESWQKSKRYLITSTIDRNEAAVQKDGKRGLTYEIKLRNWDEKRVVEVALQKGKGEPTANNKHPADLDVIQHIHRQHCGSGKTQAEAKELAQYAYDDYEKKLAKWKEGKDEKDIKKDIKAKGPKYVEFQLVPEWDLLYTAEEIAAAVKNEDEDGDPDTPATGRKGKAKAKCTPASKTPKHGRKDRGADDEEDDDESPTKKPRK